MDCAGPPSVGIAPASKSTDSTHVQVTITWNDPDGLGGTTRRAWVGGQEVDLSLWTYRTVSATRATSSRSVYLGTAGTVTPVRAYILDPTGEEAEATASYTRTGSTTTPPPGNPLRVAPQIGFGGQDQRFRTVATEGPAFSLSAPAYVSLDQSRTASLVYHLGQARPTGYVELDAEDVAGERATRISLRVEDAQTGVLQTLQNGQTEIFFDNSVIRRHRLAAQWPMTTSPTGDYKYRVVVRAYWGSDFLEASSVVRVLVVNERSSPFGLGWSLPGSKRLHTSRYVNPAGLPDGVLLTEGDGTARFFELTGCTAELCGYNGPGGDLSTLVRYGPSGSWARTWRDGSMERYNANGTLYDARDRFGNTQAYHWNGNLTALSAIDDPAGKRILFEYNQSGYVAGYVARIRDPGGRTTELMYDGNRLNGAMLPNSTRAFEATYNGSGVITAWKDYRGTTTYYGFASGAAPDTVYTPIAATPTLTVPVRTLTVPQRRSAMRFQATSLATPAPAVTADSVFARVTDPMGHASRVRQDVYGNVLLSISPSGEQVSAQYAVGFPIAVTANGRTVSYDWTANTDLAVQSVNGSPVYEAWYSRPVFPDSSRSGGQVTHYRYGARNELAATWTGTRADSAAKVVTLTTDTRGRVTQATTRDGIKSSAVYSPTGWQNTSSQCEKKLVGETLADVCTSFGWDAYGRTNHVNLPDGGSIQTTYDLIGRKTGTMENGRVTTFGWTGPDLTSLTDPSQKVYTWQYDALGRVTVETDPDGRTRRTGYDSDGLVAAYTDRRGVTVSTAYDNAHRVAVITAPPVGNLAGDTIRFAYLTNPSKLIVSNRVSTDTLEYNPVHGALARQVSIIAGRRYTFEQSFDAQISAPYNLTVTATQNGTQLWGGTVQTRYNLDPVDPALGLTVSSTTMSGRTTTFGYDNTGRHVRTTYPTGQVRNFAYDEQRRPGGNTFAGNLTLSNATGGWTYYDAMGRLSHSRSIQGDTVRTYGYDLGGRLNGISVTRELPGLAPAALPGGETFAYDAVGNRTDLGAAVAPQSNRYTQFDGWTLYYDEEGNLTSKVKGTTGISYHWNALGQLSSVGVTNSTTGPAGHWIGYAYNGFGERIQRANWSLGENRYFLYHQGNLFAELDANGMALSTYTHAGIDNPVSLTVGNPASGTTYHYVNESPGHVAGLLDGAGNLANHYRYKAFGARGTGTRESIAQPLQYMARELDASTGLYYVRARWYDRDLGRFVSEDPIGFAGGINTYAYVGNDPVNLRDPSGLRYKDTNNDPNPLLCRLRPSALECRTVTLPTVTVTARPPFRWNNPWAAEHAEQDAYQPGDYARSPLTSKFSGTWRVAPGPECDASCINEYQAHNKSPYDVVWTECMRRERKAAMPKEISWELVWAATGAAVDYLKNGGWRNAARGGGIGFLVGVGQELTEVETAAVETCNSLLDSTRLPHWH